MFKNFKKCNAPKRKPDSVSRYQFQGETLVSSVYWYGYDKRGRYMIRMSGHWGNVGDNIYLINGKRHNGERVAGKTYL